MYGLHCLGLVGVFNQIKVYYCFYHVGNKSLSYKEMSFILGDVLELTNCSYFPWIDYLGLQVIIQTKAIGDVFKLEKKKPVRHCHIILLSKQ